MVQAVDCTSNLQRLFDSFKLVALLELLNLDDQTLLELEVDLFFVSKVSYLPLT